MKTRLITLSAAVIAFLFLVISGQQSFGKSTHTTLVSTSNAGEEGNGTSARSFISADGKYIVFQSGSTNLDGTTSGTQIFLRNVKDKNTTLISVDSSGTSSGSGPSTSPTVSSDGTLVAFESLATDLTADTVNGTDSQIFVYNTSTSTTTLISKNTVGNQGSGNSFAPYISADGKFVAFYSNATDLVSGGSSNFQVYMRNLTNNTTTLISKDNVGIQGDNISGTPSISADGSIIAFASLSTNLTADPDNGKSQVLIRNQTNGTMTLISKNDGGAPGNDGSILPIVTADGRYVVFTSDATNLVVGGTTHRNVYLHDRTLTKTTLLSKAQNGTEGNGDSASAFISADGRYVAFASQATNLVANDVNGKTDIFVRDVLTGRTTLASVSESGIAANDDSTAPSISTIGKQVAFQSVATNLTTPVTSGQQIFVRHEQGINILFMVVPAAISRGATTP